MTSVAGAGYQSRAGLTTGAAGSRAAGSKSAASLPIPSFKPESTGGPEAQAADMEARVHSLLEASTIAAAKGDLMLALERAKEAGRRERALNKFRESNGLSEALNADLTFSVCFNLAHTVREREREGGEGPASEPPLLWLLLLPAMLALCLSCCSHLCLLPPLLFLLSSSTSTRCTVRP
jgi:hypothetical protein